MIKKPSKKSSILSHEHPMYGWAALAVASLIIVGLAGWYLLVYQQGLDEELLLTVKQGSATKQVSSHSSVNYDVDSVVNEIESEINMVADNDFDEAELSDQSLEITN